MGVVLTVGGPPLRYHNLGLGRRLRDRYRDKPTGPVTVKKEVATFRLIWNWAVAQDYLTGPAPTKGLRYPKTEEKPPFMTQEQIEKIIKRGGLTEKQQGALWECLILESKEVQEVLDHVKGAAQHPGGQFTICEPVKIMRGKTREVGVPLTRSEAHDHFKRTLAN